MSGRNTGLRCERLMASTTSASRAQITATPPFAVAALASAVPQAPPPMMPNLRMVMRAYSDFTLRLNEMEMRVPVPR